MIFVIRPLIVSLIIAIMVYWSLNLIFRDQEKAALITGLSILLFSSYQLLFLGMNASKVFAATFGRRQIFLPLYIITSTVLIFLLIKIQSRVKDFTMGMNVVGIVLIAMPLLTIFSKPITFHFQRSVDQNPSARQTVDGTDSPDVYYFILDGYSRADYLKQFIKFDNSEFLNSLLDRGFFIGDCSLSNYSFTRESVASSLNMTYIQDLPIRIDPKNTDESIVDEYIRNNQVRRILESAGYQTVAFETGYTFTELSDAKFYYAPENNPLFMGALSSFEALAINDTLLGGLKTFSLFKPYLGWINEYHQKFLREKFIIDKVQDVPDIPGNKFVFVHMTTSHRPYIFNADGSLITDDRYFLNDGYPVNNEFYNRGYTYQIEYTNSVMLKIVDKILSDTKNPPVIIIQGDHGTRAPGRFSILNAIYYQGKDLNLYSWISPVNTFRIVLTKMGLGTFDTIPDISYFSNANKSPFDFRKITRDPAECKIR